MTEDGDRLRRASEPANPDAAVNRYGHFSDDGREFIIEDPRTPRPWTNIVANPRLGLAVSQTGGGFTWIDNSQLAVITRWRQDLTQDNSGKFLFLHDSEDGTHWSLSPAPMWPAFDRFRCRHGLGYTVFESTCRGIDARWTLFVHPEQTIELWLLELTNRTDRFRLIDVCACLEWCCGVAPAPRREFGKLFIETEYLAERQAIIARNHMWEVPSARWGHWNRDFPYLSAFACSDEVTSAQGDKAAFWGCYGDGREPAALGAPEWKERFGRHHDPIGALRSRIVLPPGASHATTFGLGVGGSAGEALGLLDRWLAPSAANDALAQAREAWVGRLAEHRVETPLRSFDAVVNDWVRYQAISSRLWGRCGYYQQSGAIGFRDQLQDSQVWLTIDPERCRTQIALHAAHQFADGSVYHWWHPLSEQGHVTKMTDDLLWLAFVTANYVKETGDLAILDDRAPFLDDPAGYPLAEHIERAFARVRSRTSERGLPYIGGGDWNDGLSAVGLGEKGESFWLAEFLVGLLLDWAEILRRTGADSGGRELDEQRADLVRAINLHGWDGAWYLRATLDDGSPLGSSKNTHGRIYLNSQTWAILNDVATPERARACWKSVKSHLVTSAGPLLLAPAYETPVESIGYITRYAPGLRENGGVYTHAATWAIAAACRMRDHAAVGSLLAAIDPTCKDPDRYLAEPYVLPGNVDGPASPHHGRAGWTWYTGSAAWLHRVVTQWVLGVRPEWDGLRIDPCLPPGWNRARMTRPYRGARYEIDIERCGRLGGGAECEVTLDGALVPGSLLPMPTVPGVLHKVRARCTEG